MEVTGKVLTKKEAAARVRVSDRTLDRLSATDGGPRKIRLSPRRVGYLEREIDEYLSRCATNGVHCDSACLARPNRVTAARGRISPASVGRESDRSASAEAKSKLDED
jgi:predicted DNA-binding transcriptional regulator AlpA